VQGGAVVPVVTGMHPNAVQLAEREVCFSRADRIPARPAANSTWRIVDQGRPGSGIHKLGWLSTRVGDMLAIQMPSPSSIFITPPSGMPPPTCAAAYVTLGFLASGQSGQGALELICHGCACASPPRLRVRGEAWKQRVSTRARDVPNLGNATVTATISFIAALTTRMPCVLYVEHVEHVDHIGAASPTVASDASIRPIRSTPSSHVRIDSLFVREASGYDQRQAKLRKEWWRLRSDESPLCVGDDR